MNAQHTSGPWTMQTVRTSCGVCFKVGPFPYKNGELIHACIYADYPGPASHKEAEANARLIAAAPDLLAACNGLMLQFAAFQAECLHQEIDESPAVIACRNAIAKATGSAS